MERNEINWSHSTWPSIAKLFTLFATKWTTLSREFKMMSTLDETMNKWNFDKMRKKENSLHQVDNNNKMNEHQSISAVSILWFEFCIKWRIMTRHYDWINGAGVNNDDGKWITWMNYNAPLWILIISFNVWINAAGTHFIIWLNVAYIQSISVACFSIHIIIICI